MLDRLAVRSEQVLRRWIPDPFVFAALLTILTALAAMVWTGAGPAAVLAGWYDGFWTLLEFGMQIALILATGSAVALSPPVARSIDALARRITRPVGVYLTVLVFGSLLVLVSWGWVVVTAVLGRELARRVPGVHYPYLVACAFFSSGAWVVGLSSSIPLLLNTPGNFLIETGRLAETIPVTATLGSPLNLTVMAVYLVVAPTTMWLLRPRTAPITLQDLEVDPTDAPSVTVAEEADALAAPEPGPSDTLNNSALLQTAVAAMGLAYLARHFAVRGFDLDLNLMIFSFLVLGMLLHRRPVRYVVAMARSCSNISGIVFQFPFYAGIMGIMMATGLGAAIASWAAAHVGLRALPLAAYITGAVVNFSIPSAGGEWAVVGPPLVGAVRELAGAAGPDVIRDHVARVALATAYGESVTNLLQPFFLLTVLPVMGAGVRLQARDVVGHFFVPFLVLFTVIGLVIALFPV